MYKKFVYKNAQEYKFVQVKLISKQFEQENTADGIQTEMHKLS